MSNIDNTGFPGRLTSVLCIFVLLAGCTSQQSSAQLSSAPTVEDEKKYPVENMPVSQPAEDSNTVALSVQQGDMTTSMPDDGKQVVTREQHPEIDQGDVVWIQQRLKDLGYYNGPVDGSVGQVTRGAIKDYQRDQDVTANGLPSAELREFMWRNGG
jgi:hypothetical protein